MRDSDTDPKGFELGAAMAEKLLALGVSEVVIAAGARNLEIAVAVWRAENLHCWHHFEERCAGFFALGRSRAKHAAGRPVAVLTTSGTAAAELLPAIIEAYYLGVPLIAVTADRPVEYRGTGAPQAIEQRALFGRYADWYDIDNVDALALLPNTVSNGPLHLNICLEEPSSLLLEAVPSSGAVPGAVIPALRVFEAPTVVRDFFGSTPPERCLVIIGSVAPGQGGPVAELIEDSDCSIIAEAISNLPYSESVARRLISASGVQLDKIDKILRIGGIPTCRLWRDLEKNTVAEVAHVTDLPFTGLARNSVMLGELPAFQMPVKGGDCSVTEDTGPSTEGRNYTSVSGLDEFPDSEIAMLQALVRSIPRGALVFLGNSLPIREWNAVFALGKHRCFANRGANGIDGNLSTFLGLAAREESEAWAVVGDLTALYDLAACFVLPQIGFTGRLRIVVVNNRGGKIFSRLPALDCNSEESVNTGRLLIENQHNVDFAAMAGLWDIAYRRIASAAALQDIGEAGIELWELLPDPMQSEACWQSLG